MKLHDDDFERLLASSRGETRSLNEATQDIIREIRKRRPLHVVKTEWDPSGEFVVEFEEDWTK